MEVAHLRPHEAYANFEETILEQHQPTEDELDLVQVAQEACTQHEDIQKRSETLYQIVVIRINITELVAAITDSNDHEGDARDIQDLVDIARMNIDNVPNLDTFTDLRSVLLDDVAVLNSAEETFAALKSDICFRKTIEEGTEQLVEGTIQDLCFTVYTSGQIYAQNPNPNTRRLLEVKLTSSARSLVSITTKIMSVAMILGFAVYDTELSLAARHAYIQSAMPMLQIAMSSPHSHEATYFLNCLDRVDVIIERGEGEINITGRDELMPSQHRVAIPEDTEVDVSSLR